MSTEPTPSTRPATDRPTDEQPRNRPGAPIPGTRTDPWATGEEPLTARNAPRTFDPFCTRRLRNLADGENAATPDSGA